MQHSITGCTDKPCQQLRLPRRVCADLLHVGAGDPSVGEEARVAALGLLARVGVGAHRPIMAEALGARQHLYACAINISVSCTHCH